MKNCNISQALAESAARFPDRKALVHGERRWTFREIEAHAAACASGLRRLGLSTSDRALLMVKPSLEFISLTFALFRLGIPVILIDPGMGYRNLLRCAASVKPTVFIGIPQAQIFRKLFPRPFASVGRSVCVGGSFPFPGTPLEKIVDFQAGPVPSKVAEASDLAAIIFTTGSTGPPKGVHYGHGIFQTQLEFIRDYYEIGPDDVDLPAFPLFALFSIGLGACTVIPEMNPAHPAKVDPEKFTDSIRKHQVTYSFGSPAIWNVVSRYCLERGIVLDSLRKVLMAGAPVPGELIERVSRILPEGADIHTPYGATEALPVASVTGAEVLRDTWSETRRGKGTCVGRPLPGMEVKIIAVSDTPIPDWHEAEELPDGDIGEIVVRGPVVTGSYDGNERENSLSKITDRGCFWHRMGDTGWLDDRGRLWFCGRKAHRVRARGGDMYTIPCESIFNEHPLVLRSALVGVPVANEHFEIPVLIAEPHGKCDIAKLCSELKELGRGNALTSSIEHFMVHHRFPVDIRHNAKIFREQLARWAAGRLKA